jgi:hypothetical protein
MDPSETHTFPRVREASSSDLDAKHAAETGWQRTNDAERAAVEALRSTVPTTRAGALTLIGYVTNASAFRGASRSDVPHDGALASVGRFLAGMVSPAPSPGSEASAGADAELFAAIATMRADLAVVNELSASEEELPLDSPERPAHRQAFSDACSRCNARHRGRDEFGRSPAWHHA